MNIQKILSVDNVAEHLSDNKLLEIADAIIQGYEVDKESMREWKETTDSALKLAKQTDEIKMKGPNKVANIKFPLISKAVLETGSRLMSEVIKNGEVVRFKTIGKDPEKKKEQRAFRLQRFMNYQLLFQQKHWERETDRLVHLVAMAGIAFRKTYFDPFKGYALSEFIPYEDMVINHQISSLEEARRITQHVYRYRSDIIEGIRLNFYRDVDTEMFEPGRRPGDMDDNLPDKPLQDDDAPILLLEQHCFLDIDEDGYPEPYVVLMHEDTKEILSIVPRFTEKDIQFGKRNKVLAIKPENYFIDYIGMPSPDGGYWPMGFGQLMYHLSKTANNLINQLVDAGTLHNNQAGIYSRQLRISDKGGLSFGMNEWKPADTMALGALSQHFFPLPTKEPSPTILQLLGIVLEASKDLASLTDTLMGKGQTQNVPASTILTLEKQGLTVFNAMHRRIYNSFREEFKRLYDLNREYLKPEDYEKVIDEKAERIFSNGNVVIADFDDQELDIFPVFNPEMSTERQNLAKAEIAAQQPGVNPLEISKMVLRTIDMDPETTMLPEDSPPSIETQKISKEIEKISAEVLKLQTESQILIADSQMNMANADLNRQEKQARAIESLERSEKMKADSYINDMRLLLKQPEIGAKNQLQEQAQEIEILKEQLKMITEMLKINSQERVKKDETRQRGSKKVD